MKLDTPPQVSDQQRALAAVADREWPADRDAPLVAECTEREPRELEPLRVMAWHIPDLGGGLRRSVESHARIVDAYVALLGGLGVDVCIVLGARDSLGEQPVVVGSGKDAYVMMRATPADRGPAELRRVVQQLGGGWSIAFPKRPSNGEILYGGGTTVGVLYRNLPAPTFGIADIAPSPALGLGCKVVHASFDAPKHGDAPIVVAASLGPIPRTDDPDLIATAALPSSCLFAISAAQPFARGGAFAALGTTLGARYRLPRDEGTDVHDGFWDRTVAQTTGLVRNFLVCNPADVDAQDQEMHWQALPAPEHPQQPAEMVGQLRDALLVCDRRRDAPCRIEELRVVDLVAAMLPDAEHPEPERADLPQERGLLASQLADRRAARSWPSRRSPANDLAEARAFADELSVHWPIVLQLHYRART